MTKFFIIFLLSIILNACSIKQEVTPIPGTEKNAMKKKICIENNLQTKEGFLAAYSDELKILGYNATIVNMGSQHDCTYTTTYIGLWSWDMAIYLSFADIRVYKEQELIGRAMYDARKGGGRIFDKFVKGDSKVRELVRLLFNNEMQQEGSKQSTNQSENVQ